MGLALSTPPVITISKAACAVIDDIDMIAAEKNFDNTFMCFLSILINC
jgi:hypothetical protein